ncbi:3-oxoacid CoA-transferase subunit A [Paracidovorax cattleyae]|uniref:3-oxoadipate CoA-transferase, alpha subunit n=1 Tax=Paracidovorax cattleyae TaxID=80868 RepID=A0A1H0WA63_9BURK|nr:3-oxoacid CoA-transferase subunit A [Paracidovorax cattleyae]SDP87518.1 3-oxoadipate CoA-transferase, alpha subunit [Paracidovorax cattleyae]
MIDKQVPTLAAAVADIPDGARIMVSGFGGAGLPYELLDALAVRGLRSLTIISNNAGSGTTGIAQLVLAGQVSKVVCSFPRQAGSTAFDTLYLQGRLALELVPQGTLAERIRAGGAGIGGFFTPTGAGTELAEGKETRVLDGVPQIFELPLHADYALIRAHRADRWGNLTYHGSGRNFGPLMATAARCTIVQVDEVVELGTLDPEHVVTPGVFVQRVVASAAERTQP